MMMRVIWREGESKSEKPVESSAEKKFPLPLTRSWSPMGSYGFADKANDYDDDRANDEATQGTESSRMAMAAMDPDCAWGF